MVLGQPRPNRVQTDIAHGPPLLGDNLLSLVFLGMGLFSMPLFGMSFLSMGLRSLPSMITVVRSIAVESVGRGNQYLKSPLLIPEILEPRDHRGCLDQFIVVGICCGLVEGAIVLALGLEVVLHPGYSAWSVREVVARSDISAGA